VTTIEGSEKLFPSAAKEWLADRIATASVDLTNNEGFEFIQVSGKKLRDPVEKRENKEEV
jgi:hypothetical protein